MIKNQETQEITRSNINSEQTFTIKASTAAFQILSSGLYSDKIQAIIRELSCNAYDAHVSAGKADVPIEIKLPTRLDPTFYVKDYGTGLSREQVEVLYTTYFESTKTDSNDFIGALGLGSKSPFSYVSTFVVESRYNGTKSLYTCFINEQGLPSLAHITDVLTEEENGLTIQLSAKQEDVSKFELAAKQALRYFAPRPIIMGYDKFVPYETTYTISGSNWKLRQPDDRYGCYVIQGFIAYPIDAHLLMQQDLSPVARSLLESNIDLFVDIGLVDVAASREALSYDPRTVTNLVGAIEQVATEFRQRIQEQLDACSTKWAATLTIGTVKYNSSIETKRVLQQLQNQQPFIWNGEQIWPDIRPIFPTVPNTKVSIYIQHTWSDKLQARSNVDINVSQNTFVIVDTDTLTASNRLVYARWLKQQSMSSNINYKTLIIISPVSKKGYNQREIDDVIESLGHPEYIKAADVGIVKPARVSQPRPCKLGKQLRWIGFPEMRYRNRYISHKVYSHRCWKYDPIDLTQGGFYVPLNRFTIQGSDGNELSSFDTLIKEAYLLDLISSVEIPIYGFRSNELHKIQQNNKWINIIDHIREQYILKQDIFNNNIVFNELMNVIGSGYMEILTDWITIYEPLILDGKFKTFMNKLHQLKNSTTENSLVSINKLASVLSIPNTDHPQHIHDLLKEWSNVTKQYGMLQLINCITTTCRTYSNLIIDHINLIEKIVDKTENV